MRSKFIYRGRSSRDRSVGDRIFGAFLSLCCIIALWELSAYAFKSGTNPFPPPSHFLSRLESGLQLGIGAQAMTIPHACFLSVARVSVGMLIAVCAALPIATAIARSNLSFRLFFPMIQFFCPIAPVAWVPFALLFFGIGDKAAIFIVFMGVFFLLTLSFTSAIRSQIERYSTLATALGASSWDSMIRIYMPAALPRLAEGVRINFLAAWVAILAGEMTGLGDGLGAIVMLGRNLYDYNLVALGIFLIAVVGLIVDIGLQTVRETVLWW